MKNCKGVCCVIDITMDKQLADYLFNRIYADKHTKLIEDLKNVVYPTYDFNVPRCTYCSLPFNGKMCVECGIAWCGREYYCPKPRDNRGVHIVDMLHNNKIQSICDHHLKKCYVEGCEEQGLATFVPRLEATINNCRDCPYVRATCQKHGSLIITKRGGCRYFSWYCQDCLEINNKSNK